MVGHENWNDQQFQIEQEGSHTWSGNVTVWAGTSEYESHGRKSEGPTNGDWEKSDSIKLAGCKPRKIYCTLVSTSSKTFGTFLRCNHFTIVFHISFYYYLQTMKE